MSEKNETPEQAGTPILSSEAEPPRSLEEMFTEEYVYFVHNGWYLATYRYKYPNGEWRGEGCAAIGANRKYPYWDGNRFQAAFCRLTEEQVEFCDVHLNPGDTVYLKGWAGKYWCEIVRRADMIRSLEGEQPAQV